MHDCKVFVGLDYHQDSVQVCVMNRRGHGGSFAPRRKVHLPPLNRRLRSADHQIRAATVRELDGEDNAIAKRNRAGCHP